MKRRLRTKNVLLAGMFMAVMLSSAIVTGVLSARSSDAEATRSRQDAVNVVIYDDMVSPNTISVKVGETVLVNNNSSVAKELSLGSGDAGHDTQPADDQTESIDQHTGSHDHSTGFSSGVFDVDEAWQVTFSEAGTYFLHDHSNPNLNILVVVYK